MYDAQVNAQIALRLIRGGRGFRLGDAQIPHIVAPSQFRAADLPRRIVQVPALEIAQDKLPDHFHPLYVPAIMTLSIPSPPGTLCYVQLFAALPVVPAAAPGITLMRRIFLIIGGCLVLLLCSAGLVVARGAEDDAVPIGATDVRIDRPDLSHMSISYRVPRDWMLFDIYTFFGDHGWARDQIYERSLQRNWTPDMNATFAIFVRRSLFGLVSEVAIVGFAPTHAQVQVRLQRCFKIEPWLRCP
jgi:hypothetical protein